MVLIPFVLGFFVDRSRLVWFAPFRVILFSLIVAYGIATRKIMEVGLFLRRAMSYVLLTAYLLALYGLVWWLAFATFASIATRQEQIVSRTLWLRSWSLLRWRRRGESRNPSPIVFSSAPAGWTFAQP